MMVTQQPKAGICAMATKSCSNCSSMRYFSGSQSMAAFSRQYRLCITFAVAAEQWMLAENKEYFKTIIVVVKTTILAEVKNIDFKSNCSEIDLILNKQCYLLFEVSGLIICFVHEDAKKIRQISSKAPEFQRGSQINPQL